MTRAKLAAHAAVTMALVFVTDGATTGIDVLAGEQAWLLS
jgi:hypothetical protein